MPPLDVAWVHEVVGRQIPNDPVPGANHGKVRLVRPAHLDQLTHRSSLLASYCTHSTRIQRDLAVHRKPSLLPR